MSVGWNRPRLSSLSGLGCARGREVPLGGFRDVVRIRFAVVGIVPKQFDPSSNDFATSPFGGTHQYENNHDECKPLNQTERAAEGTAAVVQEKSRDPQRRRY